MALQTSGSCDEAIEEVAGSQNLRALPNGGEVSNVSGYQPGGSGLLGTVEEDVVIRIFADTNRFRRPHPETAFSNELERRAYRRLYPPEAWTMKNLLVLGEHRPADAQFQKAMAHQIQHFLRKSRTTDSLRPPCLRGLCALPEGQAAGEAKKELCWYQERPGPCAAGLMAEAHGALGGRRRSRRRSHPSSWNPARFRGRWPKTV